MKPGREFTGDILKEMRYTSADAILVVDDDHQILDAVSSVLVEFGFNVTACDSAREAECQIRKKPYTAVLTDIKMHEISGIELLGKIQILIWQLRQ